MNELLQRTYFGNSIQTILTSAATFIGCLIAIYIFRIIILKRFKKIAQSTTSKIDDLVVKAIEKTAIPLLYFAALYLAMRVLTLNEKVSRGLDFIYVIIVTYFLIKIIISILKHSLHAYLKSKDDLDSRQKQLNGIVSLISFIIWGLGLIFLLDNLGFKISAVITGLGIGGIAIALAAQTILGDLFNYFVIFLDKPFEIGDFITVDDKMGNVEYIGIKTTRIRSLSGEQIIFSNSNLTGSRIHNFKRMQRRRVLFRFLVDYSTPQDTLKEIPLFIKDTVLSYPENQFDRSHFASFTDAGLLFENVYFINTSDYNRYMDIQQDINLKIHSEFDRRGIRFSFPGRNYYVNTKDS